MNPIAALDTQSHRRATAHRPDVIPTDGAQLVDWITWRFDLTQDVLAAMLGASVQTLGRWKRNEAPISAVAHMTLLARHLLMVEAQTETPSDATQL